MLSNKKEKIDSHDWQEFSDYRTNSMYWNYYICKNCKFLMAVSINGTKSETQRSPIFSNPCKKIDDRRFVEFDAPSCGEVMMRDILE